MKTANRSASAADRWRGSRKRPLVAVGVNFGVEPQWVQNVLVAGSCRMELRTRALPLGECRLLPLAETREMSRGGSGRARVGSCGPSTAWS